jgi:hypothetical protein
MPCVGLSAGLLGRALPGAIAGVRSRQARAPAPHRLDNFLALMSKLQQ